MKNLNGKWYVKVKDEQYIFHPDQNKILRKCKEPKSLRTYFQVLNRTNNRRIQKVIKIDNDDFEVKIYPKKKEPVIEEAKIFLPNCPSSRQNYSVELDRCYQCQYCDFIVNRQKHQIDKMYLDMIKTFLRDNLMRIKKLENFCFNG